MNSSHETFNQKLSNVLKAKAKALVVHAAETIVSVPSNFMVNLNDCFKFPSVQK